MAQNLFHPHKNTRISLTSAFIQLEPQDPSIIHSLIQVLQRDSSNYARYNAVRALQASKSTDSRVHQAIATALEQDSNRNVRAGAAMAFLKPKDNQTLTVLAKSLLPVNQPDHLVRKTVAGAIQKLKPNNKHIHWIIVNALKIEPSAWIKRAIVSALEAIKPKDKKILLAIVDALENQDKVVARDIKRFLLTVKPTDPSILRSIREKDPNLHKKLTAK